MTQVTTIPEDAFRQVLRNVNANGRRTSVRMERTMWDAFDALLSANGMSQNDVVGQIDRERSGSKLGLTAAIRCFIVSQQMQVQKAA